MISNSKQPVININQGRSHGVPSSLVFNDSFISSSNYGSNSSLLCFDIRNPTKLFSKAKILNDHYPELKLSLSPDSNFMSFPSDCGTIRVFDFPSLKPIHDIKTDKVDKSLTYPFIPAAKFVKKSRYNSDYVLMYSTKESFSYYGFRHTTPEEFSNLLTN